MIGTYIIYRSASSKTGYTEKVELSRVFHIQRLKKMQVAYMKGNNPKHGIAKISKIELIIDSGGQKWEEFDFAVRIIKLYRLLL